jgi:replication initiation and membrane attachment protein DnaB
MTIITYTKILKRNTFPTNISNPDELIEQMSTENIVPDLQFLNTLITYYLNRNNSERALNYFQIICNDYKLTVSTLSILLYYYRRICNYSEFESILLLFKKHGILHDKKTLTTKLVYYIERKDTVNALLVFGKMIGYCFKTKMIRNVLPFQKYDRMVINVMIKYALENGFVEDITYALNFCKIDIGKVKW